jgi:hypothetical protein
MRFDEVFDNREAEPEAAVLASRRAVALPEGLEDGREEVAGDARAVIRDYELGDVVDATDRFTTRMLCGSLFATI